MPDITTKWSAGDFSANWLSNGSDLESGSDIETAITLSLFTDARALDSDDLPAGEKNRRGWWGSVGAVRGPVGSRLWLLRREKATEATRRRAVAYANEALAWMLSDGVADAVDVAAAYDPDAPGRLNIVITVILAETGPHVFTFSDIFGGL